MARQSVGPQFARFFPYILEALRQLGGAGRPMEVCSKVAELANVSVSEQEETTTNGQSRFNNQVAWGRLYLAKAGYLDTSKYGLWRLTELGRSSKLDHEASLKLFKEVQLKLKDFKRSKESSESNDNSLAIAVSEVAPDHRGKVLELLQSLPAKGFENFTRRLLLAAGFQDVSITGKSGDGGIDGSGILQINALVSFKVIFQCKRYKGAVSSPDVRDFRGAMQGRADKGIIITTGTFTADARNEAIRDGAPPIELVNGEKLIEMMENLELGLRPVKAFEIDDQFFSEFQV